MATAKCGQESIQIAAAPEDVYDLLADVTRMGEWSPECYRCEWLDGATTADVGARFRGYNLLGRFGWATTAVVIAAQRGREFAFTVVHHKTGRDETRWRYRLEPSAGGTLLTESFEFVWCPVGNRAVETFVARGSQVKHPRDAAPNRESSKRPRRAVVIAASRARAGFRASGSRR